MNLTKPHFLVVGISTSYCEGPVFKSGPRDRIFLLRLFVVFSGLSGKCCYDTSNYATPTLFYGLSDSLYTDLCTIQSCNAKILTALLSGL
jgi:hypothetical protein